MESMNSIGSMGSMGLVSSVNDIGEEKECHEHDGQHDAKADCEHTWVPCLADLGTCDQPKSGLAILGVSW